MCTHRQNMCLCVYVCIVRAARASELSVTLQIVVLSYCNLIYLGRLPNHMPIYSSSSLKAY